MTSLQDDGNIGYQGVRLSRFIYIGGPGYLKRDMLYAGVGSICTFFCLCSLADSKHSLHT